MMVASYSKIWLVILSFAIGALAVLAEPAVSVLNNQVEEVTQGLVSKRQMFIALTIGVGLSTLMAMIRAIYGFSFLFYLVPGFLLCLGLSFFVPKIYTAIAFDSSGVVSGPLTYSFILPVVIGACVSLYGADKILENAFGILAMAPIITIETLGLVAIIKDKIKVKKMTKKIITQDDDIIFEFLKESDINGRK